VMLRLPVAILNTDHRKKGMRCLRFMTVTIARRRCRGDPSRVAARGRVAR
jgi:hypothetical protein